MNAVANSTSDRTSRWERLERPLAVALLIAALLTGGATFLAMTGRLPWVAGPRGIFGLLILDLALLISFGGLIARRLIRLWSERRRDAAGARLHTRLAGLFALVSVLPSLVITVLAVLLFDFGLQSWFSDRVSTAVRESLAVAEAYEQEHRRTINADVMAVASGISRSGRLLVLDPNHFSRVLANQAAMRGLTEAVVFQRGGRVLARTGLGSLLDVAPDLPDAALDRAERGTIVVLSGDQGDRLRALVKLDIYGDTYLLVGRMMDPRVVGHLERTSAAVQIYEEIEGERTGLIITFALIFLLVTVLLLLAASWVGLAFADRLSGPIGRLIAAAERVGAGDLTVRVTGIDPGDEVGTLGTAFNRMTSDLQRQQEELLDANRQIEARRRFIETVLAGVSAGVIGLNRERYVTLVNRSACELLSLREDQLRDRKISNLSRDIRSLLDAAEKRSGKMHERQITLSRRDGYNRTFFVRVLAEPGEEGVLGFVLTFDDITELLSAQRKAAWADVARRIAHEIKNPLTPMKLSIQHMEMRIKEADEDTAKEIVEDVSRILIEQIDNLSRIASEFSSFANLPNPEYEQILLNDLVASVYDLFRTRSRLHFNLYVPIDELIVQADRTHLIRVMNNLVKNAVQSIPENREGHIIIRLRDHNGHAIVMIEDNGKGIEEELRDKVFFPNFTTKSSGTGLGLAICKNIIETFGGTIYFTRNKPQGTIFIFELPLVNE